MNSKKPFLIAEIGGNHQGNKDKLWELTELAADTGVDCVKYQLYTGDTLVNPVISPDRNSHFKKFELPFAEYSDIADFLKRKGKQFSASFWNWESYLPFDGRLDLIKVGSGDLTHFPLLKKFAETGKKIVLSTGLSTYAEVAEAVEVIRQANSHYRHSDLGLLQCTSMYPIPDNEANLAVMDQLKTLSNWVGYSDHTVGTKALELAMVREAEILEFHFTDDVNNTSFRDHKVSLDQEMVAQLIGFIDTKNQIVGQPDKMPTASEIDNGHVQSFRRACYPGHDMDAGEVIREEDLVFLRPCEGIGTEHYSSLLGKRLNCAVSKCQALKWEYFHD